LGVELALEPAAAEGRFLQAVEKGLRKIMSKMGISTLPSYCGAQMFEILGLGMELTNLHFPGTPSPIGGLSLQGVAREALERHKLGDRTQEPGELLAQLPGGGELHQRAEGEVHFWNPLSIAKLQIATRQESLSSYQEFSREIERLSRYTLRGQLQLRPEIAAIPLSEVEPAARILRRFTTGAMSFGALGKEAHETLAIAMNRIGGKSNSGEGGEDAARFTPEPSGDSRNSAIKQVASGRFGVTAHYLVNARELQIKIAQGAKPGEGGQLPGYKVDIEIARLRHSTPGVTLISPPPHHDIYSIEDLAQLIFDLKNINPTAVISVKLVAESGVGTIAAGVAKAHADKIVISGDSGGTGASPLSSIKYAGGPWELGLAETQQALVYNGLRGRVRLETDGQLKTGWDVAVAALLGAEEYSFSTAPLVAEGCVMMRKCHLNICPVGVATQDPELRAKFQGKPEHVIRYFHFVAEELREIMSKLGFRTVEEMVGRSDCLEPAPSNGHWKVECLDLTRLLAPAASRIPEAPAERHFVRSADYRLSGVMDQNFLLACKDALERQKPVHLWMKIRNSDRATGALLSSQVAKLHGSKGLPPDTISINFSGSAGQSFGAFLAAGIAFTLKGEANDYVGKGLSGGSIHILHPGNPAEAVLAGNTCLYGATSGELFVAGMAGERFAVRNSGALAVVEGTGDHGCEYMTGGRVIVLGPTGKNFAAGMSGGIAFVYNPEGGFASLCNLSTVDLEPVLEEAEFLRESLARHCRLTGSPLAMTLLARWPASLAGFVRVMPKEYKLALKERPSP
jgi:glutamate synthase (NADPH/NADH) large chain/glutamate synthase (ferredoxin)